MNSSDGSPSLARPAVPNLRLLCGTGAAVLVGVVAVFLCYLFVDRPVATWVHSLGLGADRWLKQPTYWNAYVEYGAPFIVALLVLRRAFGPWRDVERVLLATALSVLVASDLAEQLKVVFGRPWPETWTHDNSSFIGNGDYAFRWFRGSDDYGSFPSGHTTVICAAMSVLWYTWPKLRWLYAFAVLAVVVGLVGNDYHFVGDVVAGGFLGWLCGRWSFAVFGLAATFASSDQKS